MEEKDTMRGKGREKTRGGVKGEKEEIEMKLKMTSASVADEHELSTQTRGVVL